MNVSRISDWCVLFPPVGLYPVKPSGFHPGGLYAVPKLAAARTGLVSVLP
jgi:hypothetical protein